MAQRSDKRRPRPATKRQYPRTARLNTLLQQIVAEYLERIDDEQLELLTVTGVEVDADLNKAVVWISTLADESRDSEILDLLGERYRKPLQAEIARSARIRKTPEVTFAFDPAIRTGARIEHILSSLHIDGDDEEAADADGAGDGDAPVDDGVGGEGETR